MKILKELSLILGILFFADLIQKFGNLPIPATVLGMIILLLCLMTGLVKLDHIENVSNFFMDHLTFLFVPSCVGVMVSWGLIRDKWGQILVLVFITTVVSLVVIGLSLEFIRNKFGRGDLK